MNRVQTAITEIRNMNNDELNSVIDAIKLQRTYLARTTARAMAIGDTVEFDARGRTIRGVVTKINRKTVVVREQGYGQWKVTASMLRMVEAA